MIANLGDGFFFFFISFAFDGVPASMVQGTNSLFASKCFIGKNYSFGMSRSLVGHFDTEWVVRHDVPISMIRLKCTLFDYRQTIGKLR